MMMCVLLLALLQGPLLLVYASSSTVRFDGIHLFVDLFGLTKATNLSLVQHQPLKSMEWVVVPDQPWEHYLLYYNSMVRVSGTELRLYYDAFGPHGRFLCVAVSNNSGMSWFKPALHLVSFNGSTSNNIVLGTQTDASGKPLDANGETIEPGVVFLDTNPGCLLSQRFKAVLRWSTRLGATMFASADGFFFTPMTSSPLLYGSDTQDVVFFDNRKGAYVYYGRSHKSGGQPVSCAQFTGDPHAQAAKRSINHFIIGSNVTNWPTNNADSPDYTIFNTDALDPPCMDLYTSSAMALHDAYFMFPLMFNHFTEAEAQARGNDGFLEPRMLVSRDGSNFSYVSRRAWLPRGTGTTRPNQTGIFQGAVDAGSSAVVAGMAHVGDETWLYGWGGQYTHGSYVGFPEPGGRVLSGLQKLILRRNGFVSLSTGSDQEKTGLVSTMPIVRPSCEYALVLELNIATDIGLGASVQLLDEADEIVANSERIVGNFVSKHVLWKGTGSPDLSRFWKPSQLLKLQIEMNAADLFSFEFICARPSSSSSRPFNDAQSTIRVFV